MLSRNKREIPLCFLAKHNLQLVPLSFTLLHVRRHMRTSITFSIQPKFHASSPLSPLYKRPIWYGDTRTIKLFVPYYQLKPLLFLQCLVLVLHATIIGCLFLSEVITVFNLAMSNSIPKDIVSISCNPSSIFFDYLFQSTDCRQLSPNKQQLLRHYFDCFANSNGLFGCFHLGLSYVNCSALLSDLSIFVKELYLDYNFAFGFFIFRF